MRSPWHDYKLPSMETTMPGKHHWYCCMTDYQFMQGKTGRHCAELGLPQCPVGERRQRTFDMDFGDESRSMAHSWNGGKDGDNRDK